MWGRVVVGWACVLIVVVGAGTAVARVLDHHDDRGDGGRSVALTRPAGSTRVMTRAPDVEVRHRVFPSYTAVASASAVPVYDRPGGSVQYRLANPTPLGSSLTFLVDEDTGRWLRVWLPVQPNGTRGWVRTEDVLVVGDAWHLAVRRGAHRLDVYHFDTLMASLPVAIGQNDTPTPGGRFYLLERVQLTDPSGPYGPWAFGLSGFSESLSSFNGQDPVIALHGTNDPSTIGSDVSHGCIRLRNADITALVRLLPLGTPVDVLA